MVLRDLSLKQEYRSDKDDKKQKESFLEYDGEFYHIYHGTLQETSPDILLQYDGMTILLDEQWELRMLLSKIKEKKEQIFNAYIKNCLVEAGICITKTKNGLNTDPYHIHSNHSYVPGSYNHPYQQGNSQLKVFLICF